MNEAVTAGDLLRTHWPLRRQEHLNLYLGSGRMGGCFDVWGLQNNGLRGEKAPSPSGYDRVLNRIHLDK